MADDVSIIKDPEAERRIQDAAHVLIDLCNAAIPVEGTDDSAKRQRTAQSLSLAVQVIFMVDDLQIDKSHADRLKGSNMSQERLVTRFFGLGAGIGHAISCIFSPIGQIVALQSLEKGMQAGQRDRENMKKGRE